MKTKKVFKKAAEEIIGELIDESLEKQKKIEKINDKMMKRKLIKTLNTEEINNKIRSTVKIFYEISADIKKFNSKLMKKMFWNEVDQKLEKLGKKLEAKKLQNTNKFKEYRKSKQKI